MKRSTSWIAVLPSLVIPICLGMTLYLVLSYLISHQYVTNEMFLRYITGHPISKVTVAMFFIGVASLGLIGKNIFEQFNAERKLGLKDTSSDEESTALVPTGREVDHRQLASDVDAQIAHLEDQPNWVKEHYLWQRITAALNHIRRTDSTAGVEDELKYLSDLDIDRQQQRYSLVRILIWATPMLGFLGTVLGISEALGGINVGAGNDFQSMMNGLRGSLYVAFDTTALALTLSMLLMFSQFLADRFETQLLSVVDQRARGEIARHFDLSASNAEVQKLADELKDVAEKTTQRQIELWKKTIESAEQAWSVSLTEANAVVQANLTEALDENVANLAHYLGESIGKADESMTHRWQQWQVTLSDNARVLTNHQQALAKQAEQIQQLIREKGGADILKEAVEQNRFALKQNRTAIETTQQLQATLSTLDASVRQFHDASLAAVNDARHQVVESQEHLLLAAKQHRVAGRPLTAEEQKFVDRTDVDETEKLIHQVSLERGIHVSERSQQTAVKTPKVKLPELPKAISINEITRKLSANENNGNPVILSLSEPEAVKPTSKTVAQGIAEATTGEMASKADETMAKSAFTRVEIVTNSQEISCEQETQAPEPISDGSAKGNDVAEVILKGPSPEELDATQSVRSASDRARQFLSNRRKRAA